MADLSDRLRRLELWQRDAASELREFERSMSDLPAWRETVDRELAIGRAARKRYIPAIDQMLKAQEIADAIREHNGLLREQEQERSTLRLTKWQVIGGIAIGALSAVDLVVRFFQ